eukprot:scaffold17681_cov155-Amphora_coffeaeformis.AAC.5
MEKKREPTVNRSIQPPRTRDHCPVSRHVLQRYMSSHHSATTKPDVKPKLCNCDTPIKLRSKAFEERGVAQRNRHRKDTRRRKAPNPSHGPVTQRKIRVDSVRCHATVNSIQEN